MINFLIKVLFIPIFFIIPQDGLDLSFLAETQLINVLNKYALKTSDYADMNLMKLLFI